MRRFQTPYLWSLDFATCTAKATPRVWHAADEPDRCWAVELKGRYTTGTKDEQECGKFPMTPHSCRHQLPPASSFCSRYATEYVSCSAALVLCLRSPLIPRTSVSSHQIRDLATADENTATGYVRRTRIRPQHANLRSSARARTFVERWCDYEVQANLFITM